MNATQYAHGLDLGYMLILGDRTMEVPRWAKQEAIDEIRRLRAGETGTQRVIHDSDLAAELAHPKPMSELIDDLITR